MALGGSRGDDARGFVAPAARLHRRSPRPDNLATVLRASLAARAESVIGGEWVTLTHLGK